MTTITATISSPDGVAAMINQINEDVIDNVSTSIVQLLQQIIIRDVYKSGDEEGSTENWSYYNHSRQPTFQFMMAFMWDDVKKIVHGIARELFYNADSMDFDPDTYLHGDPDLGDLRKDLADILNVDGIDEQNAWGGKLRKPYWNNFIDELFGQKKIIQMFDEEFAQFGITRI